MANSAFGLTAEERKQAGELFLEYKSHMEVDDFDSADEAVQTIIDELPAKAAEIAYLEILKQAEAQVKLYREKATAMLAKQKPRDLLRTEEVKKDRKLIAEVRAIKDIDEQKKRLAEEAWPAIQRLDKLLLPVADELVEGNRSLSSMRDSILYQLDFCDDLAKHTGKPKAVHLRDQFSGFTMENTGLWEIATPEDRRTLRANLKVIQKSKIPESDVRGMEDINRIRVLAGFPAFAIDPLLSKASLNHSEDMVKHNFGGHLSPVPGRATFADRASEVGTSASGENVAAGYQTPEDANRGWFLSPGHFRLMFSPYKRIGFGGHQQRWTLLFGN